MKQFVEKIIDFTHDKDVIALQELYQQPSFFEIISKARSETTYSAFLRWMLQLNSNKPKDISPVMLLLDIIINNQHKANPVLSATDLNFQSDVLSRNVKISRVKAEIEKSVGEIAQGILDNKYETDTPENILKEAVKSKDRIDIFINCKFRRQDSNESLLQLIIENKIDSGEGPRKNREKGEYGKLSQTERYYKGTSRKDIPQYFVFLTPSSTDQKPSDPHFIHVTYQEILDHVIKPLLNSSSMSERDKRFLEEFKNELMFPNIENIKGRGVIAMSREQSEEITDIWLKHKELIINAIVAKVNEEGSTSFWKLDDCYFNTFPREELKEKLKACNALEGTAKNPTIKTLLPLSEKCGINIVEIKAPENEHDLKLLYKFYNENADFLLALLSAIGDSDRKSVDCFLDYMRSTSRKGRKKYSVYIGEELQGEPYLNNWETVFQLVKIWVAKNGHLFNDLNSAEIIAKLNKEIPLKENSYYKKGKFLTHLFYEYKESGFYHYDGSCMEGMDPEETKITNWDMYPAGQGHYLTINDTKITMAKMWRTHDVENFIKFITKKLGTGAGLTVETFN